MSEPAVWVCVCPVACAMADAGCAMATMAGLTSAIYALLNALVRGVKPLRELIAAARGHIPYTRSDFERDFLELTRDKSFRSSPPILIRTARRSFSSSPRMRPPDRVTRIASFEHAIVPGLQRHGLAADAAWRDRRLLA